LGRIPDFGIKAEMAAGWRAKLDMSPLATQRSVAAEMASAITNAKIQGLALGSRPFLADTFKALELSLPKVETRLLLGGLAAQLEGTLGRIAADLQERLEPVALLAVKGFAEQMEPTFKRTTAYREALLSMGWWFPPSMPMSWFVEAGKRATAGDRVGVRRYMNDIAASDYFERVLEDRWMRLEVFRRRRRFLRDGLEDHLKRRYRVSIPTLLPHLEGIAIDASRPVPTTGARSAQPYRRQRAARRERRWSRRSPSCGHPTASTWFGPPTAD
jgi:hypothetical protein